MQPRTATKACTLCGRPGDPDQFRDLGLPPVVVTICADLSACVDRHRRRPDRAS